MAEVTYRSPGVYTAEIDLSGPTTGVPVGVPAGVIGTSAEGPAYVPVTVGSFSDFKAVLGATDGKMFGPLAANEFLKNATALTYCRVLGIGDGKKRSTSTGKVTNAGFVVGAQQVQDNGVVGKSRTGVDGGALGRTYFLGCFMSQSAGSTIFSDAGISNLTAPNTASVIIRGVIMAASGVIPALSGTYGSNMGQPSNTQMAKPAFSMSMQGGLTGSVNITTQQFTVLLNGHKNTGANPNVYTCSFDMREDAYFANVLNTKPELFEEKGHLLYAHYDIHPALADLTSSGLTKNTIAWDTCGIDGASYEPAAFIVTSSLGRNAGSATIPDFECFEERFTNASAPYVISQDYGGTKYSLFRVHALGDGAYTNTRIKISVENIQPSTSEIDKYGKFDLIVRDFNDTDLEPSILEAFRGVDLNPSSDKFIARAVGDMNSYFDFDQKLSSQKIVVKGDHPVKSNYIRVEQSSELYNSQVPKTALPMGFRGLGHLVTSGSGIMAGIPDGGGATVDVWVSDLTPSDLLRQAVQPPVPLRKNVAVGTSPNKLADPTWYWGVQFMQQQNVEELNEVTEQDRTIPNLTKFFPQLGGSNRDFYVDNNPGAADSGGTVLSCDKFNNNLFSLERIQVRTGSDTWADTEEWASASYVRNGVISTDATNKTRALKVDDLKVSGNRTYGKFTFIIQGGFNGSNIFNYDKEHMLDAAAKREIDDSTSQGGVNGPTIAAYRKALDLMGGKSDVDIKLLAIPGLRHSSVTDYAIDTVENRFDAMYIMDIEERDDLNNVVTGSTGAARDLDSINVYNTVTAFKNRSLDSSFAAAYFPDTIVVDPNPDIATNVRVPPSVSVLGAFSLNDAVGHPWFAPAGFTRGSLKSVISTKVSLNTDNMNNLYDADINPLTAFPGTGVMVFGQKTLLAQASALDRVNVRRLLINIRRKVRDVANLMLFEPNRQETLDKFNALVQPILQNIQELSGVERFKVVIDSTTTTQADIENNTLRGKIFIQPTRTAEFVSLDFVVTNAGDAFDNA